MSGGKWTNCYDCTQLYLTMMMEIIRLFRSFHISQVITSLQFSTRLVFNVFACQICKYTYNRGKGRENKEILVTRWRATMTISMYLAHVCDYHNAKAVFEWFNGVTDVWHSFSLKDLYAHIIWEINTHDTMMYCSNANKSEH